MKKILVPTDFSRPARVAVDTALNIAKRTNAGLILLHVVEQPGSESFNVEGEASHIETWEDKRFTLKLIEKAKETTYQSGGGCASPGRFCQAGTKVG